MASPAENAATDERRKRALWALDESRMAKSGYAPRKRQLAEWVVALCDENAALLAQAEAGAFAEEARDGWARSYELVRAERDAAVRERDTAREALREIAEGDSFGSVHLQEIARAALAGDCNARSRALADRLVAAEARVTELEGALRPFVPLDKPRVGIIGRFTVVDVRVNESQYHAARAALASVPAAGDSSCPRGRSDMRRIAYRYRIQHFLRALDNRRRGFAFGYVRRCRKCQHTVYAIGECRGCDQ